MTSELVVDVQPKEVSIALLEDKQLVELQSEGRNISFSVGNMYLGRDEARTILQNIAQGKYNDVQVASLITVFLMRNISVEELCGFRDALLEMRIPVDLSEFAPIDIVGTGGDGKNTFNISTASCFTVAGAGFPVVKHGNYGATSVSGASNVMEQHGVKFTSDVDQLRRSMEKCNLAYLHAPLFNPALKAVAPVRKGLAVRTFFNMLGPLVNPVLPAYQLLGVYNLPLLRLYTYTYQESKTRSEERRVGKECRIGCRSRWSPYH